MHSFDWNQKASIEKDTKLRESTRNWLLIDTLNRISRNQQIGFTIYYQRLNLLEKNSLEI